MPTRIVHQGDGVAWLAAQRLPADHAVVTSLPDVSEIPALGFDGWREWFIETSALICRQIDDGAVAIFFQTDIKHEGRWVDKGHLVHTGADRARASLLWSKIVCRAPPGTTTFGRPAFARLLCFSRDFRVDPAHSTADVLPNLGVMPWTRAMGVAACEVAARFLVRHTPCLNVVDPFCGLGTMLAVANRFDLNAIGVELSPKRATRAGQLDLNALRESKKRRR